MYIVPFIVFAFIVFAWRTAAHAIAVHWVETSLVAIAHLRAAKALGCKKVSYLIMYDPKIISDKFFGVLQSGQSTGITSTIVNDTIVKVEAKKQEQERILLQQDTGELSLYLVYHIMIKALQQFLRVDGVDAWSLSKETPGLQEMVLQEINNEAYMISLKIYQNKKQVQEQELQNKKQVQEQELQKKKAEVKLNSAEAQRLNKLVEEFSERQHERNNFLWQENRTAALESDERLFNAHEALKSLSQVVVDHTTTTANMYKDLLVPQLGGTAQIANQGAKEQLPSEKEKRDQFQKQQALNRRAGCVVLAIIAISGAVLLGLFLVYVAMHVL